MKIALNAGGEIDLATTSEIGGMLDDTSKGFYRAITEGIRYGRSLDNGQSTFASGGSFLLVSAGANPGYVRSVRRVSIVSNDASAATQKCSLFLNDPTAAGNFVANIVGFPNWFTFSNDELILNPDDELYAVVTGGTTTGAGYSFNTAYKEITVDKLFLMDF
jgi:hypothetical protein